MAAGRCSRAAISTSRATVKAYFALKLAGDDPDAPHMRRARAAILAHGGAARGQRLHPHRARAVRPGAVARRAGDAGRDHAAAALVPVPSREGVVLVAHGDRAAADPDGAAAAARNPRGVDIRELFATPPEAERATSRARNGARWARLFVGARPDPARGRAALSRAIRASARSTRPSTSSTSRLNGEDGLGGDLPGHGQRRHGVRPRSAIRRTIRRCAIAKRCGQEAPRDAASAPTASPASRRSGTPRSPCTP